MSKLNNEQWDAVTREISKVKDIAVRRDYVVWFNKYAGTADQDLPNCELKDLPKGLQGIINEAKTE